MSSGKVHFKASNRVLLAGTALAFYLQPVPLAAALVVGLAIGKYANPDVRDQEHVKNYAEHQVTNSFGRIAGFLWWAYWWPIAKLIKHRNWKSHLPGPATLIAFVYLFLPTALIVWHFFYQAEPLESWLPVALVNPYTLRIMLAWAVQDFVHLAQDGFLIYWKGGVK